MPEFLLHPPDGGGPRPWHAGSAMEVTTPFYRDMELALIYCHMPYCEWILLPEEERYAEQRFIEFYTAKQGYYQSPKKDRKNWWWKLFSRGDDD